MRGSTPLRCGPRPRGWPPRPPPGAAPGRPRHSASARTRQATAPPGANRASTPIVRGRARARRCAAPAPAPARPPREARGAPARPRSSPTRRSRGNGRHREERGPSRSRQSATACRSADPHRVDPRARGPRTRRAGRSGATRPRPTACAPRQPSSPTTRSVPPRPRPVRAR